MVLSPCTVLKNRAHPTSRTMHEIATGPLPSASQLRRPQPHRLNIKNSRNFRFDGPSKCVTHVPEHLSPISPVQTRGKVARGDSRVTEGGAPRSCNEVTAATFPNRVVAQCGEGECCCCYRGPRDNRFAPAPSAAVLQQKVPARFQTRFARDITPRPVGPSKHVSAAAAIERCHGASGPAGLRRWVSSPADRT